MTKPLFHHDRAGDVVVLKKGPEKNVQENLFSIYPHYCEVDLEFIFACDYGWVSMACAAFW